jgi:hypothetical protein
MPWISDRAPRCYICRRPRREGERFSRRGRCAECGDGEMLRNVAELRAHDGPRFLRWRRACVAAFGGILPDELEPGELDSRAP